MQNIFIDVLPPWVETGLQPAFYDLESGTVLQQTARMYAKVRELTEAFNTFSTNVTNEINQFEQDTNDEIERFEGVVDDEVERFEGVINDTVEEYIEKFNDLHDYVHDYFDNLDVQEEINNKLDDMLEDGVLQEIIDQFVQSNVAWTFNTVADMKLATNLVNGSYARTLGFHSLNDGGGALYKITNSGTANEMDVIAIDTLYATLVKESTLNVKQFGAYGDDTHDDSAAINRSLALLNYAYIPNGTFLTNSTITVSANQKLYGNSKMTSVIHYSGSGYCITEYDSVNTIKFEIGNLKLVGTSKTGTGLYLWRTNKQMPTPGDSYSYVHDIEITDFSTGMYVGQFQNTSTYKNIEVYGCEKGFDFDHTHDIFVSKFIARSNTKNGFTFTSSSDLNMVNIYAYYNGNEDDTSYYNFVFDATSAVNISNLVAQESYGDNIKLYYSSNIIIASAYLSWPGLTKTTNLRQINLIGCNNIKINGTSQNGQYGVSGYNNYILGLQNTSKNCNINITTEEDFPVEQKINNISGTQATNVYNSNIFEIETQGTLKYAKVNYLKNGTLENKTDLTAVGNSSFCSWNNGKLRVDTTGQTYGREIYWKIAELPRADTYTTYIHFKSVSGTGGVSFNAPGGVTIQTSDTDYYISFTKYMSSTAEDQTITLLVGKNIVLDVIEAGICLGCSGMFDLPLAQGARIAS